MQISGEVVLHAPVEQVWLTLRDPDVLVRTIPGCERLELTGPDVYTMTVTAGVASIKGTYSGSVTVHDQQPPSSLMLTASGAGAPGSARTQVHVRLSERDGVTRLTYDADAAVGGMIGGVGQRMLSSVAKRTAGEFFIAVDDILTGKAAVERRSEPPARKGFGLGTLVGAAAALIGFAVGAVWGRRAR